MEPMTQDEAAERAQEHVDGVMAVLPEEAESEGRGGPNFSACDDPTDGGPKGRVVASVSYWIREVPVEDNDQVMDAALEYWTENGFWVIEDARPDSPFISVGNEEDAFVVSIQASIQGDLSVGASSPCVWPDGSPDR